MEDKSFELLTKMYSEFTEFRKETNSRFDRIDARLDKLESGQNKLEATLEHDIKNKLQFLHERAEGNTIKLDEHGKQLDTINNKLEYLALSVNSQDKRLEVVESRKRKAK